MGYKERRKRKRRDSVESRWRINVKEPFFPRLQQWLSLLTLYSTKVEGYHAGITGSISLDRARYVAINLHLEAWNKLKRFVWKLEHQLTVLSKQQRYSCWIGVLSCPEWHTSITSAIKLRIPRREWRMADKS